MVAVVAHKPVFGFYALFILVAVSVVRRVGEVCVFLRRFAVCKRQRPDFSADACAVIPIFLFFQYARLVV